MSENTRITDNLGRSLEVKHLNLADQFDLLEATQDRADYRRWFNMAVLVFSCAGIDGVPLPTPRKPSDFKKNAEILKSEGIIAITEYLRTKNLLNEAENNQVETAKN